MTHGLSWVLRDDYTCSSCGQPELIERPAAGGPSPAELSALRTSCSNPQCSRWLRDAVVPGPDAAEQPAGA